MIMIPTDKRAISGNALKSPKTGNPIRINANKITEKPTKQIASLFRVIFIDSGTFVW